MDPRLQQLSYSSNELLHSCPRKFQLYKLIEEKDKESEEMGVTFSFGHAVGTGLQAVLSDKSEDSILWNIFLSWNSDLEARDDKRAKNFYLAIAAVQKMAAMRRAGFLEEYEIVVIDGKLACELGFCINFPNGFRYRGYVDAILRNKKTEEIVVVEGKSTWYREVNPAKYKNSAQAIGYSILLDYLFPDLSSYHVYYIIYKSTMMEWELIQFTKLFLQRAEWIRSLVFDVADISRYTEENLFPTRGESCLAFGRECQYLQVCGMDIKYLATPAPDPVEWAKKTEEENKKFTAIISLEDLINSQLRRSNT